ncbi:MAG: Alpha-pyrone synthesis polyketide synthase-like Pks18 [Chlamydiae bacterium]|nr:Alpha-pyrone synthesis polyketide synthase-like Pks18 [Chlamydiota bacterium]
MFLKDFHIIRPDFEEKQEALLDWILNAHVQVEPEEDAEFAEKLRENLFKLGLGENKIKTRGFQLDDCSHRNWDEMKIYNLNSAKEGYQLDKRMAFFDEAASSVFEKMYPEDKALPPHLVHVTCTGYVAPSPAQKLVSLREAGAQTTVTHAYHMGCYAAIPAIRMAMGHYAVEDESTDIVHTEICSLHMNPSLHTIEQLVVQSLFADGFIKYTLGDADPSPSLKILGVLEEVIPNSISKMTWTPHQWGFQMSISKDIPVLIRRNLEGYLKRLGKKAGYEDLKNARYAIHPGGPKIIEQIAAQLELGPEQIQYSKEILQSCGNMSSATLPHVWEKMVRDPEVKPGELIVSLAFGPGLSISGALFEKR